MDQGTLAPMARVVLLETGTSHAECLPAQVAFLTDAGHAVDILVHPSQVDRLSGVEARVLPLPADHGLRWWWQARVLVQVMLHLVRTGAQALVLNTLAAPLSRWLALVHPAHCRVVAVEHDVGRLTQRRSRRWLARRLDGLLVLVEGLVPAARTAGVPVTTFAPAWFPPVAPRLRPAGECWLAVVGALETSRRNYDLLWQAVRHGLPPGLRLHLVGRPVGDAGRDLAQRFATIPGIEVHAGFLAEHHLHALLASCHGVLPLVEGRPRYRGQAISGAFNLALAYRLPLVAAHPLHLGPDLDDRTLSALPGEDFAAFLARVVADPRLLADVRDRMSREERWSFATSQRRYLDALGLGHGPRPQRHDASWDGWTPRRASA